MPKKYSKVIQTVYGRPWAILPEKMEEIASFLQMKHEGIQLSQPYVFNRLEAVKNDEITSYIVSEDTKPYWELKSTTSNDDGTIYEIVGQNMSWTALNGSTNNSNPGKRIAVLNMFGTIAQRMNFLSEYSGGTSTELLNKSFTEAMNDDSVVGIIFNTDSPGGTVPGVPELSDKIRNAVKDSEKPVYTLVNPMMASAAYWIGSSTNNVYAIPSSESIGSIGVLTIHTDISESEAKEGKKYTIFRTAENKAETISLEPLKKSTIAHIKSTASELHNEFVDAVARNLNIKSTKVNTDFGQGRAYRAKEALSKGMIHGIATLDEVVNKILANDTKRGSVLVASNIGGTTNISTEYDSNTLNPSIDSSDTEVELVKSNITSNSNVTVTGSLNPDWVSNPNNESVKNPVTTTKETKVNPKIKLFLMKEGLCKATDSAEVFTSALETWYAAQDKLVPSDEAKVLEDIQPNTVSTDTAVTTKVDAVGNQNLSISDAQAIIRISNLSSDDKLDLITDFTNRINANDPKDVVDVSRINDAIANTSAAKNEVVGSGVAVTTDASDKFMAGAVESICVAGWGNNIPDKVYDFKTEAYTDFKVQYNAKVAKPIMLGRQLLCHFGVPTNRVLEMDKTRVAKLMVGTITPESVGLGQYMSDGPAYNVSGMFSNILLDATNIMLRRSYDDGRQTFKVWMKQGESLEDFKTHNAVIAGSVEDPTAIPEDGEFEESSLTDGKETYKLVNWGRVFSHSWQLMINDRLNSFTEIPMKQGTAMVRKQNRLAYSVLKDNAALINDSIALFDGTTTNHQNDHSDTASTAAAYTTLFGKLDRKMREQKGIGDDAGTLNIPPKYVIYPPEQDDLVRTTLNSTSTDSTNPAIKNIRYGSYTPVNEAELGTSADSVNGSDDIIYMAADHNEVDTIIYAYLSGHESPVLEQAQAFDRLAVRQRIYQPFVVKALDYRGLQRNDTA